MSEHFDVAIVGAGIVGLAHAWRAAVRGKSVVVFERSPRASGASIRNFGMIWPIGQTLGPRYEMAMVSRSLWLELGREANIWVNPCGSMHLAHRADEFAVLEEFCQQAGGLEVELCTPEQTLQRSPAAKPDGLLGAMFSHSELCVNPTAATRGFAKWLAEHLEVPIHFETSINRIDDSTVNSSDGQTWSADQILVCSGADFQTLFPSEYEKTGARLCKLQMMRTVKQPSNWNIGKHIASGLTLRHYKSFEICPSLAALTARIEEETPELNRLGIHVMASQDDAGHVILGDSHEYDDEVEPFDTQEINDLILRELHKQITLPDWTIDRSWHGLYTKHSDNQLVRSNPQPNVHVCFSPGGAGMTLSLGWAEDFWERN
ncbi:MAG: TIGR03364 family FAD-dependent oxidoreductase [Planctomycetota bacterium]